MEHVVFCGRCCEAAAAPKGILSFEESEARASEVESRPQPEVVAHQTLVSAAAFACCPSQGVSIANYSLIYAD